LAPLKKIKIIKKCNFINLDIIEKSTSGSRSFRIFEKVV